MTGTYEIDIVSRPEGKPELRQTITCDAEMAVAYLMTAAHEIASTIGVDPVPLAEEHGQRTEQEQLEALGWRTLGTADGDGLVFTRSPEPLPQRWSTDPEVIKQLQLGLRVGGHPMALDPPRES